MADFENIIAAAKKRKKKRKSEEKAINFYVSEEEKAAIEVEASKSPVDLLKILENLSRPYHSLWGGLHEHTKQQVGGEEADLSKIFKGVKKGWKLEERKNERDVAKMLAPELMDDIKENWSTKIWGVDVDVASVPLFAFGLLTDPIMYIPFGKAGQLAKGTVTGFGKGAHGVATKFLGAERVAKIVDTAGETWLKTGAKWFNTKSIFKAHRRSEDLFETGKEVINVSSYKAQQVAREVMQKEKEWWKFGRSKYASEAEGTIIGQKISQAADEGLQTFGSRYEHLISTTFGDLFRGVPDFQIAELAEAIAKNKPTRGIVRSIVNYEYQVSRSAAIARFKGAKQIYREASKKANADINAIHNGLKGELRTSGKLLKNEVNSAFTSIKDLQAEINRAISGEVVFSASKVGEILTGLKQHITGLKKFQVGWSKNIVRGSRSLQDFKVVSKRLQDIQSTFARGAIGTTREGATKILSEISTLSKFLKKEVGVLAKSQTAEMKAVGGSLRFHTGLQQEIATQFKGKLGTVLRDKGALSKWFASEQVLYEASKRKLKSLANQSFKQYRKNIGQTLAGGVYQQAIKAFKAERTGILTRHFAELPKELQSIAWKTVKVFDDYKQQLIEGGVFKGHLPPVYFPRKLTKESMEEIFGGSMKFSGSGGGGSLRFRRKLKTAKEFSEYAAKNGGKVESDVGAVLMDYVRGAEVKMARNSIEKEALARMGRGNMKTLRRDFPQLTKAMDYLFSNKIINTDSAPVEFAFNMYGKVLNAMKAGLTIINPQFIVRNILGFPFLASTTAGMKAGMNPRNYTTSLMIKSGLDGSIGKYSYKAIRKAIDESGYFSSTWTRGQVKQSLDMLLDRYHPANPMKYLAKVFQFNAYVEDLGRTGAMVANLRTGKNLEEAMVAGKRAMFDYNLINSPVDKVLQGLFGFYVWPRRNLPIQIATLFNDPKQYEVVAQVLNKVSNREKVTDKEMASMSNFDKQSLKWFGEVVDGVRQYYVLGFHPMEQAYQTLNVVTEGSWRKGLGQMLNPALGTFMDFYYSKDSFYGKDFGYTLPPAYTELMPEKAWKMIGLTLKEVPKYRNGEQVGTHKVLYGDPDTVAAIRKFPVASRFIGELAHMLKAKADGETKKGALKYFSGIRRGEMDIPRYERLKEMKAADLLRKKARTRGAKTFQRMYVPKSDKKKLKAGKRYND